MRGGRHHPPPPIPQMAKRPRSAEYLERHRIRSARRRKEKAEEIRERRAQLAAATNERRRARHHRKRARTFKKELEAASQADPSGLSVVSEDQILYDRTRWVGPGWLQEERLTEEATHFLIQAEKNARASGPTASTQPKETAPAPQPSASRTPARSVTLKRAKWPTGRERNAWPISTP